MHFRFTINVPPRAPTEDVIEQVRGGVRRVLKQSVRIVESEAPGDRLKRDLTTHYGHLPGGAFGEVHMPYQLKFTLLPGTREHFIPGGLAVHSYAAASEIQKAKGYPMGFWWEREGKYVYRWSVFHPGYKGSDWGEKVHMKVSARMEEEAVRVGEIVATRWGSKEV